MLSIILISVALVVVIFSIANQRAKKSENSNSTIEEEPLGYETSSFAVVEETINLPVAEVEEPLVFAKPPAKKPKKTSAKPKTKAKAPKKK